MLAEILKSRRLELNYTQQEIADKLFVSRQAISRWETGKSFPDIPTLIKLSEIYQLSLDFMLKGDVKYMKQLEKDTQELKQWQSVRKYSLFLLALIPLAILLMLTIHEQETLLWKILFFSMLVAMLVSYLIVSKKIICFKQLNRWMKIGCVLVGINLILYFLKLLTPLSYPAAVTYILSFAGASLLIYGTFLKRQA